MYYKMKIGDRIITPIDWEMTPELSFGTYESWGGRERVRDNSEKVYYFFIDGWDKVPRVYLMERAVKHARILAEIDVPASLVQACVKGHGRTARYERSFAIDGRIRRWIIDNVLESDDGEVFIRASVESVVSEVRGDALPVRGGGHAENRIFLPSEPMILPDEAIDTLVARWNFFEGQRNPSGIFENTLVQADDSGSVIDQKTGLQWQVDGMDICSAGMMKKKIALWNREGHGGFHDWRLPTPEEALSLLNAQKNCKGMHIHPCFSMQFPFVFVSGRRRPGGYWFVDFLQGRVFWASGSIPGGFARLCRTVKEI